MVKSSKFQQRKVLYKEKRDNGQTPTLMSQRSKLIKDWHVLKINGFLILYEHMLVSLRIRK